MASPSFASYDCCKHRHLDNHHHRPHHLQYSHHHDHHHPALAMDVVILPVVLRTQFKYEP